MTHLSDYSYLDRGVTSLLFLSYILHRIYRYDRFLSLYPTRLYHNILKGQLRSITVLLLFLSLLFIVIYDIIVAYCKYTEGFTNSPTAGIVTKPTSAYNPYDVSLIDVANALIAVSWSLHASCMFLLIASYNHIVEVRASVKFMASWEFRCYRIYAVISLVLYGVFQGIFSYDALLSAVVPQFVYHTELFAIWILLLITNYRLRGILTVRANAPLQFPLKPSMTMPSTGNGNGIALGGGGGGETNGSPPTSPTLMPLTNTNSPDSILLAAAASNAIAISIEPNSPLVPNSKQKIGSSVNNGPASPMNRTNKVLERYIQLNYGLAIFVFMDFIGLFPINADILSGRKEIYKNKFWTDLLTKIFNIGFNFSYVVIVWILYQNKEDAAEYTSRNHSTNTEKRVSGKVTSANNKYRPQPDNQVINSIRIPADQRDDAHLLGYAPYSPSGATPLPPSPPPSLHPTDLLPTQSGVSSHVPVPLDYVDQLDADIGAGNWKGTHTEQIGVEITQN